MAHKKLLSVFRKAAGAAASTKERIINTTASVISAPKVIRRNIKGNIAASEAKVVQQARKFDNAPNFQNGKPTDAFKVRSAAADIKRKRIKKNKN